MSKNTYFAAANIALKHTIMINLMYCTNIKEYNNYTKGMKIDMRIMLKGNMQNYDNLIKGKSNKVAKRIKLDHFCH